MKNLNLYFLAKSGNVRTSCAKLTGRGIAQSGHPTRSGSVNTNSLVLLRDVQLPC